MLTAKDLRGASKKWRSLPEKEKRAISNKVDRMVKDVEDHEAQREHDIKSKIKDMSHEVAGYCHKKFVNSSVSILTSGSGKKVKCSICGYHDAVMSRMPDGAWYCQHHKSLWDCRKDEKQNERSKYVNK